MEIDFDSNPDQSEPSDVPVTTESTSSAETEKSKNETSVQAAINQSATESTEGETATEDKSETIEAEPPKVDGNNISNEETIKPVDDIAEKLNASGEQVEEKVSVLSGHDHVSRFFNFSRTLIFLYKLKLMRWYQLRSIRISTPIKWIQQTMPIIKTSRAPRQAMVNRVNKQK